MSREMRSCLEHSRNLVAIAGDVLDNGALRGRRVVDDLYSGRYYARKSTATPVLGSDRQGAGS